MNKIITMTYETIKRIHIFKTLNEDIMDFINPSIKTYKKMFNETIEHINYFDKFIFSMKQFRCESFEEDTGLITVYLTSVETLSFNKKRECMAIDFIQAILNFEIYEFNICW